MEKKIDNKKNKIFKLIKESIEVKKGLFHDIKDIEEIIISIINVIKLKNKILICGNGGSAADSQHFAAELIGRFKFERNSYPAIALTTDSSILTAVANDYGFDQIFSKQVEGLGNKGDLIIGISTSGNSKNIIKAFEIAKKKEIKTIGFLGNSGGLINNISDFSIIINSNSTARIQESHILLIHIICELIEVELSNE